jgi:hypothetical protein
MSTQTPKLTATPVAVFPNPVNVLTIPLPPDYPRLPITEMTFQPVAYNQGTGNVTFVTVLVPLLPKQMLIPATEIIMDEGATGYTFTYAIEVETDDRYADFDRLALMSFSFLTGLPHSTPFKVSIEVLPIGETNSAPGKVVMDSNMDPTFLL